MWFKENFREEKRHQMMQKSKQIFPLFTDIPHDHIKSYIAIVINAHI